MKCEGLEQDCVRAVSPWLLDPVTQTSVAVKLEQRLLDRSPRLDASMFHICWQFTVYLCNMASLDCRRATKTQSEIGMKFRNVLLIMGFLLGACAGNNNANTNDAGTMADVGTSSDAGGGDAGMSSGAPRLYVTLVDGDALGVIDPATNTKIGEIAVGLRPHDVICAPDGATAYVTNPVSNSLSVIDTATNTQAATIDLGADSVPWHVAISPNGSQVFVALQDSAEVALVNSATRSVERRVTLPVGPWAIAAPANDTVFVTMNGSISGSTANGVRAEDIARFDPTAGTPTPTNIELADDAAAGDGPHGIVASPDGTAVYVAAQASHEIWRIHVADGHTELVATIPDPNPRGTPLTPGFPTDLTVSPDGMTLIAVNHDIDSISVIRLSDDTILDTVSTGEGSQPWGAIVSPDGETVYVSTSGSSTVAYFSLAELRDSTPSATMHTIAGLASSDGFTWCDPD
jgi:YVTN family beta-propeller protein